MLVASEPKLPPNTIVYYKKYQWLDTKDKYISKPLKCKVVEYIDDDYICLTSDLESSKLDQGMPHTFSTHIINVSTEAQLRNDKINSILKNE